MSSRVVQSLVGAIVSLVFILSVHRLGRQQKVSFRYAVGWMVLGTLGLVAGLLVPLAEPVADLLSVSPAALLGLGGMILLLVLCVQLSISISGLQEQVRVLAEEASFLREKIEKAKDQSS